MDDLPAVVLATTLAFIDGRGRSRAAIVGKDFLQAAVAGSPAKTWRGALRRAAALDRAYRWDQFGAGMELAPGGGWLRVWSGTLRFDEPKPLVSFRGPTNPWGERSPRFALYREVSTWDADEEFSTPFPEELLLGSSQTYYLLKERTRAEKEHRHVKMEPCLLLNEPTEDQIAVAGHANFFGPAQRWCDLAKLLDKLEERRDVMQFSREFGSGTSNTAVAIMPYSGLDSMSRAGWVSGLSLPEDARSVYMGGHGTTTTVAAVIIRLRPL
jgi:hypothetical protein